MIRSIIFFGREMLTCHETLEGNGFELNSRIIPLFFSHNTITTTLLTAKRKERTPTSPSRDIYPTFPGSLRSQPQAPARGASGPSEPYLPTPGGGTASEGWKGCWLTLPPLPPSIYPFKVLSSGEGNGNLGAAKKRLAP